MTVRAHDLALGDLSQNAVPVSIWESSSDLEVLLADVIELENQRVGFAAIGARVLP
jgi:hypothetical protein